eukprot:CAMPEP_0182523178 /NCGR_PEP_ID=MMETSP1323-20130603/860_1 /TAXON_ID=236787 /ORGANISM="Florenciella parvula, Strain RCC1693" /LENGTH=65 /DNA_ID=CAMNT_0024731483 /DNA_START=35 /DNA_END=229 /DNA_ORIENTATION=-
MAVVSRYCMAAYGQPPSHPSFMLSHATSCCSDIEVMLPVARKWVPSTSAAVEKVQHEPQYFWFFT